MIRFAFFAGGALAASAVAAGAVFTDRASFESAAGAAGKILELESFENLPLDPNSAVRDTVVTDDFTISAVNEGFEFLPPLSVLGTSGPGGTFATDGVQHVNVGSLGNGTNDVVVTFTFDFLITAFFADFTDLRGLDNFPDGDATIENGVGDFTTLYDGFDVGNPSLVSVGFVSDTPFDTITLIATAGDSFGIDNVSYGIPSPGAGALLAIGGLAAARRRR